MNRGRFVIPALVITVGITWSLNVLNLMPGIDWIWTAGLAVVGVLVVAAGGINKFSMVVGPFLIAGAVCSVLRQSGRLAMDIEVPALVTVFGALLLLVEILNLPVPESLRRDTAEA
jgi:hypothetical protein